MIRKIKNFYWVLTNINKLIIISQNKPIIDMISKIFEQVEKTALEGRPFISEAILVNIGDGKKISDYVTIWTGAHDGNPVKRLGEILNQRNALRDALEKAEVSEEMKASVKMMIDNFR